MLQKEYLKSRFTQTQISIALNEPGSKLLLVLKVPCFNKLLFTTSSVVLRGSYGVATATRATLIATPLQIASHSATPLATRKFFTNLALFKIFENIFGQHTSRFC